MRRTAALLLLIALLGTACSSQGGKSTSDVGQGTSSSSTVATPAPSSTTNVPATTTTSEGPTTTLPVEDPAKYSVELVAPLTSDIPHWSFKTVDVGPDGLPFVTSFDHEPNQFHLVRCLDRTCSERETTIWNMTNIGAPASVESAPDGLPVVCLGPRGPEPGIDGQLWISLRACSDPPCSTYEETRIEETFGASMTILRDGTTFVAHGSDTGTVILRCDTPACTTGGTQIDVNEFIGGFVVGNDGLLTMAVSRDEAVHVVRCLDTACAATERVQVAEGELASVSGSPIVRSSNGSTALLVTRNTGDDQNIVVVTWRDDPQDATNTVVDELAFEEGELQSMAISAGEGLPVVAWVRVYYEWESLAEATELLVARCEDPACKAGTVATLLRGDYSAGHLTIDVDANGHPVIVYPHWDVAGYLATGEVNLDEDGVALIRCEDPACEATAIEFERW